jgi:putative membrane protein
MKRAMIIATAAVAALSLTACNKNANNTAATGNEAMAGNTAPAAGGNEMAAGNMNPGQSGPVNQAQNAAGAAVGQTSAATLGSHDTHAFVENLVQGNTYEIEAGKLAEQKAHSPDVKAFARMMVHDHTALGEEAKPVIAKAGQTPPTGLDQRRQGLLDNLKAAGPQDFDKMYIDQQVAAHKETVSLLTGYNQHGSDADLKALAAKATPIVQRHLDRAQELQSKLAAGGGAGGNTTG